MATCIKCGLHVEHSKGSSEQGSICPECAGILADAMTLDELVAAAKVGFDALIDEVTGYQDVRPSNDLSKRHKKYRV